MSSDGWRALVGHESDACTRACAMAPSMPAAVGKGLPTSSSSIESVQWRICWRSPAGTPTIVQITSTGKGPEKSTTASKASRAGEPVEQAADHLLAPPAPTRRSAAA